ncbi:hypothetical protein CA13_10470 [Planctomycetes bacterium CA13]|uniref:Uncharacterized protein n=2 Tax=Novipirellula herctigrandis TaxID=2527986 RepID=A0A5C5YX96_9BACT|nr:hypothetical protein CA13_10470 [Planctomycetes bacterium CA13]
MLVVAFARESSGTDQVWDTISVEGTEKVVRERPLWKYWPRTKRPKFDVLNTANWSGFYPHWEIRDSMLFLVGFEAYLNGQQVDPAEIFGEPLPVAATWYSGKLTILNRGFAGSSSDTHYAKADIHLVEEGKVIQVHRKPSMRFSSHPRSPGFDVVRHGGRLVVESVHSSRMATPKIIDGDVLHGIINTNGVSTIFTTESIDLVKSLVRIEADGGSITLLLSTPPRNDVIRKFRISRDDDVGIVGG